MLYHAIEMSYLAASNLTVYSSIRNGGDNIFIRFPSINSHPPRKLDYLLSEALRNICYDSFLAVLRIYVDMLKQANRIVSNCTICGKLIIKYKTNNSDFCSQECRNVHKREWTKENRIKNAESDVQCLYTQLYNNTNNQKRKLKRSPEALEQYNALFNELKEKALTMKRGLSDDSPLSEVRAFSVQLIEWEQDLRDLAEQLHEDME